MTDSTPVQDEPTLSDENPPVIPECTNQILTVPPVDLDEVYEITPLGNLGPPGHTFPTEHMYFHISAGGTSSKRVPLRAPGDVYIVDVTGEQDVNQGEFSIFFALCQDIYGYFFHVKALSDELKEVVADIECEVWTVNPGNICARRLVYRVDAGTVLGSVGDLQGNFDFGAYDYRATLDYINPWRYGDPEATGRARPRSLSIVCPLDLYDSETRSKLYDELARTANPKCGEVMQDVPGTVQGNWYLATSTSADSDGHLAFVYDNHDPSVAVISVGGGFTDFGKWEFSPQTSGLANRHFSDVTPDGNIFCYDQGQPGKILVQLTGETELSIERQDGSCLGTLDFNNPSVYIR